MIERLLGRSGILGLLIVCACTVWVTAGSIQWDHKTVGPREVGGEEYATKVIYCDDGSDKIEAALTFIVEDWYIGFGWVIVIGKHGGEEEALWSETLSREDKGKEFSVIVAGCITEIYIKLPIPQEENRTCSVSGTLSISYRRECEEEKPDTDTETGLVPEGLRDGVTIIGAVDDQVRVMIVDWLSKAQASQILECLRLDLEGCYSVLIPNLIGITFPFDLFEWCGPIVDTSSIVIVDAKGNEISDCTEEDSVVYVKVVDASVTGDSFLQASVQIGDLSLGLMPLRGQYREPLSQSRSTFPVLIRLQESPSLQSMLIC